MEGRLQPASSRLHAERLLAGARLMLCVACLVPAWTGVSGPPDDGRAATTMLIVYAVLGCGLLGVAMLSRTVTTTMELAAHTADVGCAVAITTLTGGSASPFLGLFMFAVLAAALRWRFRETLLTAAIALAALVVDALLGGKLVPDLFVVRGTSLGISAVLIGALSETEKGQREQAAIIGEMLATVQAQRGFRVALRYLSSALLRLTDSEALLVATRELGSERTAFWTATRGRGGATLLTSSDLAEDSRALYFFPADGDGWSVQRRRRDTCSLVAIDRDGSVLPHAECRVHARFWQVHQYRAATIVDVGFGTAWRGRVFLLRNRRFTLSELRFIHRALSQLVPVMHNQYLVRRLRSDASAAERRRVAHELHDGIIQSLVGLEMHTAALRRTIADCEPAVAAQLERLQRMLNEEAKTVRDVMHHIRPFDAGPGQFIPAIGEIVERFGRDTGIAAHFYAPPQDIYVPPRAGRELARTLQEALINVRRHSGARRVEVEFRADDGSWRLDIENDGRPFGFLGRLALEELEARRLGPRVIKERVRDMGGDLVIESSETSGVRLEISLPRAEGQSKSA